MGLPGTMIGATRTLQWTEIGQLRVCPLTCTLVIQKSVNGLILVIIIA